MVTLANEHLPSAAEYEFIRQLVYEHSRIDLGTEKKEMVGQRLRRRLKATGLDNYQDYCDHLKSPGGQEELTDLIDAISTNVTSFFREESHFDFLASTVLPQWVAQPDRRPGDVFRAWSAACSSGEEPYSIAIVLEDFFSRHPPYRGQVIASDISTRMLQRAQEGIYRLEQVKLPEVEWLKRYFLKGVGAYQGCCRVKAELKKLVAFHHANLLQPDFPAAGPVEVIFCRNVMIYFDQKTQEELVDLLTSRLVPGGYLLVGHSESLIGLPHPFSSVCASVYRLNAAAAPERARPPVHAF
jgi:chemotaxis protein methyltransferase CheR